MCIFGAVNVIKYFIVYSEGVCVSSMFKTHFKCNYSFIHIKTLHNHTKNRALHNVRYLYLKAHIHVSIK